MLPVFKKFYQVRNSGQDSDSGYDGPYHLDTASRTANRKPVYKILTPKGFSAPSDYYLFYFDSESYMYWAIGANVFSNAQHYKNITETAEYPPQDNWSYLTDGYETSKTACQWH